MGFWSRLFGARETDDQKIARAKQHLDDDEPKLAIAIVARLAGPEADEIRRRAAAAEDLLDARAGMRPAVSIEPDPDDPLRAANQPPDDENGRGDPYRDPAKRPKRKKAPRPPAPAPGSISIQYGADGSTTIGTGDGAITLNAPISDDDGRPRSTDALDVARRVLASTAAHELDPRGYAFVEAALVLARAGEALPRITHPNRRAIAELAVAASTRDPERIAALVRAASPDVAEDVAWFVTPLAVRFAARELGALALEGLVRPSWMLIEALVHDDPATCARIVGQTGNALFAGEALLLGDIPGLAWTDWRQATADQEGWRALEIRRLARRGEVDAALALEQVHAGEHGPHYAATLDLARALARLDAASAVEKVAALDPIVDNAGWLTGLTREGHGGEIVDDWIAALGPLTYDPFGHFAETLAACIALGDPERARRCIAKGGPTGWQIACAAHDPLALVRERDQLLAACYERVQPSVVAGRAVPHGMMPFGAGHVVIQPAWLAFTDPQPIETLALVAGLGDDMPRWANLR